jgi:Ca2+-binding RTX toxin-like protein
MIIYGTDAPDTLTGTADSDDILGLAGNDVIDGGAGNDTLFGGSGNNLYRFGRHDGHDHIASFDGADGAGDVPGRLNTLEFKSNVLASDVTVARVSHNNLVLTVEGGASITARYFFAAEDPWNLYNPLQRVHFADGTEWDLRALIDRAMTGSAAADQLLGTRYDDTIDGREGDDRLDGGDGNDTYLFGPGDGADWLPRSFERTAYTGDEPGRLNTLRFKSGVAAADVTAARMGDQLVITVNGTDTFTASSFFAGDDPLNPYNPLQQAVFADGTVWNLEALASQAMTGGDGDDTIIGTMHADVIDGGHGNDRLLGGRGNDTYRFGLGDGDDLLHDQFDTTPYTGDPSGRLNTLAFKAGVQPAAVSASRNSADLILRLSATDSFTVKSFFSAQDPKTGFYNPLQQATFTDGTVWNIDALTRLACTGGAGADTLVGTVNDDILDGRGGDDSLDGGVGNDTYLFGFGDGADRLQSRYDIKAYTGDASGRLNTLQFKDGVTPGDVLLTRHGADLEVTLLGSDSFTVESFYGGSDPATHDINPLQQIRFADGSTWDLSTLVAMTAKALTGTGAGDDLSGTPGVDAIAALAGDDVIRADAGNDSIDGGAGMDLVVYAGPREAYEVTRIGVGFKVAARAGAAAGEDSDQLRNVERLQFSDGSLALDLDGQAGQVARILGAVFGADAVVDQRLAGTGLSLLEQGLSYEALAAAAVSFAGKTAHADIVDLLWNNIVGTAIPAAERGYWVGLLDGGLSVGAFTVMAADSSLNAANIDLVGLASTGLAYA